MKLCTNKIGMTIIELMIAVAISAIVILTTSLVLFITFRTWNATNIATQFRREIALSMAYLSKDVRESNADDISTTAATITFSPNHVRAGTHTYTADFNNGTLVRTINGGAVETLISGGLVDFFPDTDSAYEDDAEGVSLRIALQNVEYNLDLNNETFISVRNR